MRRVAARSRGKPQRQQKSISTSFPSPLGGWNDRDALAAMSPMDAVALENLFPGTSYVELRGGSLDHATGLPATGKTLAVYNGTDGSSEMFVAAGSGIYDATSPGAVGASVATIADDKMQYVNFGDGTNNYLMMFNDHASDKPQFYNGSSWMAVDAVSSPALTGLDSTAIASAFVSKNRLFFIETNSLSFWYLAAGAAGGALVEFPLDGVANKGGYLVAGATWTFDSGSGVDDAVVLVTSKGQVMVYSGTNPSAAADWGLIGVFDLGEPLGRRCFEKLGGDLVLLCQNGAFPLTEALRETGKNDDSALTDKIQNSFNTAARAYAGNFGWQVINYPARSAVIFNIPLAEGGTHEQYVMNSITKSWCRFKGWDSEAYAILNQELYFTTGAAVVKAWTGASDNGADIVGYGKQAFNYLKRLGVQKRINLYRPMLSVNGPLSFLTDIDVDYKDTSILGVASFTPASGALWDIDEWDSSSWAAGLEIVKNWTSPDEYTGVAISAKIKVSTNSLTVQWFANDLVYEIGGIL